MRDCPDGAMRDQLPLYVSGRLDDADQAKVEAHLKGCADCAAEVELLRATVRAYDVSPIDAATIAARIPTAKSARRARPFHSQPLWRVAAAITLMIAGTAAVMVVNQSPQNVAQLADSTPRLDTAQMGSMESVPVLARNDQSLSFGNNLTDLTDEQIEALLVSLDKMDGTVATEPEALTSRIAAGGTQQRNP